jgi:two-component system NarL family response regulator
MLIDRQRLVRAGLRAVVERDPSLLVIGEVCSLAEAATRASALHPDVIVLDLSEPELQQAGESLLASLRESGARLLRLEGDGRAAAHDARPGQPDACLPLSATGDELLSAIHALYRGDRSNFNHPPHAGTHALTARERDVLRLLAEGRSSKQIASDLHIAVATVETHRRQISARLQLHSIAELTKYAIRTGLTSLA